MVKRLGVLPYASVEVMKAAATQEWDSLERDYLKQMCDDFVPRLTRVIAADGGPIEFFSYKKPSFMADPTLFYKAWITTSTTTHVFISP